MSLHGLVMLGMIGFGGGGKDSRTSHLWIVRRDTQHLGKAAWETPVAEVIEGVRKHSHSCLRRC